MTENDEWIQVALTDDAVVAEQILRLRQAPLLPRKRKGKAPASLRSLKQVVNKKATVSPLRASPTTPLSWSEATSVSGCGGCAAEVADESSHFSKLINTARSEVDALSRNMMETFTAAPASKRASLNQSRQPLVAQVPKYSISQGVACIKLDQCLPNLSSEGAKGTSFLLPDLNLPVDESGFEG